MNLRKFHRGLLLLAIGLPIACLTLRFVAGLLNAMEDATGGTFVLRINTAFCATWAVVLVLLLIVQSYESLQAEVKHEESTNEER